MPLSQNILPRGIAIAVQADVSNEADVTRLFEETRRAFGTLDILVNNAVFQQFLPIEQASAAAFHQRFNVNVLGLQGVKQMRNLIGNCFGKNY